ncbi:hypothetical protein ACOMHN_052226 [Nucella lapillus]
MATEVAFAFVNKREEPTEARRNEDLASSRLAADKRAPCKNASLDQGFGAAKLKTKQGRYREGEGIPLTTFHVTDRPASAQALVPVSLQDEAENKPSRLIHELERQWRRIAPVAVTSRQCPESPPLLHDTKDEWRARVTMSTER